MRHLKIGIPFLATRVSVKKRAVEHSGLFVLKIAAALGLSDCSLSAIAVRNSAALELPVAHEVYLRSLFENSIALEQLERTDHVPYVPSTICILFSNTRLSAGQYFEDVV